MAEQGYFAGLVDEVVDLAGDYVRSGGLRVSIKTNLGPEVPVAGYGEARGGLSEALGVESAVIVRDREGRLVQTIGGDPPATDPIRALILWGGLAALAWVAFRGLTR